MLRLEKEDKVKVNGTIIQFGLAWDEGTKITPKGFLGRLTQAVTGADSITIPTGDNIDLDASALLFSDNEYLEILDFQTLRNPPQGTTHSGDNLTGQGKGDDEIITIDTSRLKPTVKTIFLTINSYRGQSFDKIANASCRITADGQEVAYMDLDTKLANGATSVVVGRFYVKDGQWRFQNLSYFPTENFRTGRSMERTLRQYL